MVAGVALVCVCVCSVGELFCLFVFKCDWRAIDRLPAATRHACSRDETLPSARLCWLMRDSIKEAAFHTCLRYDREVLGLTRPRAHATDARGRSERGRRAHPAARGARTTRPATLRTALDTRG